MGKVSKNKKLRVKTIEIDAAQYFKHFKNDIPQLKKAARKVVKSTKWHFKKYGWDLDYSFLVTDIFYEAFGHHLENYLWKELARQKVAVVMTCEDGRIMLRKRKPKKKVAKK